MVLPFISIYLHADLEFAIGDIGIIMAFYGLGSICGAFLGGLLTDRIGFYKVQLVSLFTTSLSFVGLMYLQGFAPLCAGIFVLSFLADTIRPANMTAIQHFSKPENLTRSLSLVRLAVNLGFSIGPFLGGYVASILGFEMLFIINGSAIFLGGIIFFLLFRNKEKRSSSEKKVGEIIQLPWKDLDYLTYLIPFCVIIIVFFQLIYTIPLFFKNVFHFDESQIGIFMAMNGFIIVLIEMPLVHELERKYKHIHLVVFGAILIGLSYLILASISHAILAAFFFTILITIGEILNFPFSNTVALRYTQNNNRGKYMGLYTMTFSVAHVFAPLIGLQLSEIVGFYYLWIGAGITCILMALVMYTKNKPKDELTSSGSFD